MKFVENSRSILTISLVASVRGTAGCFSWASRQQHHYRRHHPAVDGPLAEIRCERPSDCVRARPSTSNSCGWRSGPACATCSNR